MGLFDLIKTTKFGYKGEKPASFPGSNPQSTLHYESSINGTPPLINGAPSRLDLDGKRPKAYMDNPPK